MDTVKRQLNLKSGLLLAIMLVLLTFTLQTQASQDQAGGNGQWVPGFHLPGINNNSSIITTVKNGSDLYVGGTFSQIGGENFNQIARFDGSSWHSVGGGIDGDGGIYILLWVGSDLYAGGEFSSIGGVAANNIARWDGTNWNALGSGTNDNVEGLAWDGANLYVGGFFTTAGGDPANRIARWNGASWSPLGTGLDSLVFDIEWDGTYLYAGGFFNNAGGNQADKIARWDGTAWEALGSGINGTVVRNIHWDGNDIYAGGSFSSAGSVSANNIAKWNGTTWSNLGSGTDNEVFIIQSKTGEFFIGGDFIVAGGNPAQKIARWDGGSWHDFDDGIADPGTVLALEWLNDTLYVGGGFPYAGTVAAAGIAKWENDMWSAVVTGNGINGNSVRTIHRSGTDIYAGGTFPTAGSAITNGIARWNGTSWSPLGTGLSNNFSSVFVLQSLNDNLYAGGDFFDIGGTPATFIARWDGANWNAVGAGTGPNDKIQAMMTDGTNLIIGGEFTNVEGVPAPYVAQWDGTNYSTFGSGVNAEVEALQIGGGNLYVGGDFTTAGGSPANHIAYWDGSNWFPLGSGINGDVFALAWDGTNLYAGGNFSQAGGNPAENIAMWNGSSWTPLGSGVNSGPDSSNVLDLVWNGTELYATGVFTTAGGAPANYVARWDGSDWYPLGNGVDNNSIELEWAEGKLYLGGQFLNAGGIPSNQFAVWATSADFAMGATPPNTAVCPGTEAVYTLDIAAYNNFNDTVALSANGEPAGTTAVFAQNPITPPDSTTLTIGSTNAAAPGSYDIDIVGVATTRTHTTTIGLDILDPPPTADPTLTSPTDGATDVSNQPDFVWTGVAGAGQYLLEVATDNAFNTIVYTKTVAGTSHTAETTLANGTEHFWRVAAENLCGNGPVSSVYSFTTQELVPDVGVSPGSFTVTLETDETTNEILTISNGGTAELNWTLTEDEGGTCGGPDDIPWLSLSSTSGSIGTGQDEDVTLTFDASGLSDGTYTGSVCLSSNDPDMGLINISLILDVASGDFYTFLPAILGQ